ncbi:MAG: hypothetical protein QOH97_4110 [Actinoplanes sp.]|jgi:hypothetical protein|nr:hypothetical protein [Actinoplanes sp.]
MKIPTAVPTSDFFGIAERVVGLFRRSSRTSLNVDAVSQDVGRVIAAWSDSPATTAATAKPSTAFPEDAAAAVEHIAELLGLSHERVISAVQVAPRTYYGWKTEGRRPRSQSLGRLWPMTEAIHFMAQAHPNLAAWFHGSPEAQACFDAGDAQALVQLELSWAMRTYPRRPSASPDFGDGPDLTDPTPEPPTAPDASTRQRSRLSMTDDVAQVNLTLRTAKRS